MSGDASTLNMRAAAEDALCRLNPYVQRGVEAFDRLVRVVVRDGTSFLFYDAAALLWNNPIDRNRRWLLVWTEHYGYHAFALEDLKYHGIFIQTEFDQLDESLLRSPGETMSLRSALTAMQQAREDAARRAAAGLAPRPLLVGEVNPYGSNPDYALWPYPEQASGDRLCRMIMGLDPDSYLRRFDRINLCEGKWSVRAARSLAETILATRKNGPVVLCGSRVCNAFRVTFSPSTVWAIIWDDVTRTFNLDEWLGSGWPLVVLNHPSGLCRAWNEPGAVDAARAALIAAGIDLSTSQVE